MSCSHEVLDALAAVLREVEVECGDANLRLSVAARLYWRGDLSAGQAARVAPMPRVPDRRLLDPDQVEDELESDDE